MLYILVFRFKYFSPYQSADMSKMATAFNTTVAQLENELMQLILDGKISARIDSHNKVWPLLNTEIVLQWWSMHCLLCLHLPMHLLSTSTFFASLKTYFFVVKEFRIHMITAI